jgi:hypothetical protein
MRPPDVYRNVHTRRLFALTVLVALVWPATANAYGGSYAFDGGTTRQRNEVRAALEASAFPWSVVPARITIHIGRNAETEAAPGEIWLNSRLLDSGRFSWGVIQHEYAHQVDFFLLNADRRATLLRLLGGRGWCYEVSGLAHAQYGCERFATTLAWSFWPSGDNCLRPRARSDEAAAMRPRAFRALLAKMLGLHAAPLRVR